MPVSLPRGAEVPVIRRTLAEEGSQAAEYEILVQPVRVAQVRFEVLDQHDQVQDELYGVKDGSIELSAASSIKGSGSMTVVDLDAKWLRNRAVNWINARIRPVMTIRGIPRDIPMGVWIPTVPGEQWEDRTRTWAVEMHDKGVVFDQDIWTGATGNPRIYVGKKGANIMAAVRGIIARTMPEQADRVPSDTAVFSRDVVWDVGTTRLKIINDMLSMAGYFSLWFDFNGNVQIEEYVDPYKRSPMYEATGAFTDDTNSLMGVELGIERDLFSVPNRFVAVSQGTEDTPARVSAAVIKDPLSPFSVNARGRWISETVTGVEVASQKALDQYAIGRLSQRTSLKANFNLKHAFLPELRQNSVVTLVNSRAGVNSRASISKMSIPFDPTELCTTTLREVLKVGTESEADEVGAETETGI